MARTGLRAVRIASTSLVGARLSRSTFDVRPLASDQLRDGEPAVLDLERMAPVGEPLVDKAVVFDLSCLRTVEARQRWSRPWIVTIARPDCLCLRYSGTALTSRGIVQPY
jgi:hypothetical protein